MTVPTPSQTAGPFVTLGTEWLASGRLVADGSPGAIVLAGKVFDGEGEPVTEAMVEFWQAGAEAGAALITRAITGPDGSYRLVTAKPKSGAPYIGISIFARGLLQRLVTRAYFDDEAAANAADPALALVPLARRGTLLARRDPRGPALYNFDIHLQGERETVFFAPA